MEREFLNLEITENSSGKGLCFKRGERKSLLITAKFKKQLETFPKNVAQLIKIMNDNPENVSYLEAISLGAIRKLLILLFGFHKIFTASLKFMMRKVFWIGKLVTKENWDFLNQIQLKL